MPPHTFGWYPLTSFALARALYLILDSNDLSSWFITHLWCANTHLRLRNCGLLGANCKILFLIFGVKSGVGLNLNFEFEFESAHEFLMNLNLNSNFAKSMNLNLVFSKSMNLNFEFSFFKVNQFEFEFKNYKENEWIQPWLPPQNLWARTVFSPILW